MFPARFFPTRYFNARFWVKTGEAIVVTPSQSGYAIACYVTSTAPHVCQVTTSRSHNAGLTASDPIDALFFAKAATD